MLRLSLVRVLAVGTVMVLSSSIAMSQVDGTGGVQSNPFASINGNLSDAADRSLATALSEKPWMKRMEVIQEKQRNWETSATPVFRLRAGIERVNQLRPTIEPILREEGVPIEVSAVVLVESGGLSNALSPKGARGVWQFMPDTARRYGLVVDQSRDDRVNVEKSTHAAARYLKDLYSEFGDWSLALAAYNAGEPAVRAALSRGKMRDFRSISDAGWLPRETREYVPIVGAAMDRLHLTNILSLGEKHPTATQVVYASPVL
jgi:hypothetical protein